MASPKEELDVHGASKLIGRSESALQRYITKGELPAVKDTSGRYRILKKDAEKFAASLAPRRPYASRGLAATAPVEQPAPAAPGGARQTGSGLVENCMEAIMTIVADDFDRQSAIVNAVKELLGVSEPTVRLGLERLVGDGFLVRDVRQEGRMIYYKRSGADWPGTGVVATGGHPQAPSSPASPASPDEHPEERATVPSAGPPTAAQQEVKAAITTAVIERLTASEAGYAELCREAIARVGCSESAVARTLQRLVAEQRIEKVELGSRAVLFRLLAGPGEPRLDLEAATIAISAGEFKGEYIRKEVVLARIAELTAELAERPAPIRPLAEVGPLVVRGLSLNKGQETTCSIVCDPFNLDGLEYGDEVLVSVIRRSS